MNAYEVRKALRYKFNDHRRYAMAEEVGLTTGGARRRIDMIVADCYNSNGYRVDGFEIKVSTADLRRELADPDKHIAFFEVIDYYTLVCPPKVVEPVLDIIPKNWGILIVNDDGTTRNRGIELARGEYVLFLDDDDWWLHEYVLEMLDDKLRRHPHVDILCFSFIFRHIGYAAPIRKCNGAHWVACWCKCYKRTSIGDARFSDITDGSADVQFFSMMFNKGLIVMNWDTPFYYYNYWRDDSISARITHDFRGCKGLL